MNILVSACLIGLPTRYAGDGRDVDWIEALAGEHVLIPVCPEQLGGLPTPRTPCERRGSRVVSREGADLTAAFSAGAEHALRIARLNNCRAAILKQRSPSCGSGTIYDGSFSGTLIPGDGLTAALLKSSGLRVFGEADADACREWLARQ
ncbi:MAG: DUF523 domain-containing protein [Clostridia bacterium]|nr:DUF523 domain-containing protein [Clostridia bacterium]